jgi:hypothetical protein
MDLSNLTPALQRIHTSTPPAGSRAATYFRTYPALLTLAASSTFDDRTAFLLLAASVYGWMPRVVRVDPGHLDRAIAALRHAKVVTDMPEDAGQVADVAACLHSVVGASKLLHFANPDVFPIWDRNVEGFRRSGTPSQHHMDQVKNYAAYALDVHATRRASMFPDFYRAFRQAFEDRLGRLRIAPYRLSEVRCVELAMFELAGELGGE